MADPQVLTDEDIGGEAKAPAAAQPAVLTDEDIGHTSAQAAQPAVLTDEDIHDVKTGDTYVNTPTPGELLKPVGDAIDYASEHSAIFDGARKGVHSLFQVFDAPSRVAANMAGQALGAMGATDLKAALFPTKDLLADVHMSDILNFYLPQNSPIPGLPDPSWKLFKGLGGIATNVAADPLMWFNPRLLQPTKEAEELFTAGKVQTYPSRNLLDFRPSEGLFSPITNRIGMNALEKLDIPLEPITKGISKGASAVGKAAESVAPEWATAVAKRGAQAVGDLADKFVTSTGVQEIDEGFASKTARTQGDNNFFVDWAAERRKVHKLEESELPIINNAIESTPNLDPNVGAEYHHRVFLKGTAAADESGRPIPLFHGSHMAPEAPSKALLSESGWAGPGFYFTADPEIASSYAGKEAGVIGDVTRNLVRMGEMEKPLVDQWLKDHGLDDIIKTIEERRKFYSPDKPYRRFGAPDDVRYQMESWGKHRQPEAIRKEFDRWAENMSAQVREKVLSSHGGPNVQPVYLKVNRALNLDAPLTPGLAQELAQSFYKLPESFNPKQMEIVASGVDKHIGQSSVRDAIRERLGYTRLTGGEDGHPEALGRDFTEVVKAMGYDSMTHMGGVQGGKQHRVFIALEPEQIVPRFHVPSSALGKGPKEVRDALVGAIEQHAGINGVALTSQRIEQLADAALEIKATSAANVAENVHAGRTTLDNIAQQTMENYLTHKLSPEASKALKKSAKLAEELEIQGLIKKVEQSQAGLRISSFDGSRMQRKFGGTLTEINKKMEESKGIKGFFIEDPFVSAAIQRITTRNAIRDKELVSTISRYGIPTSELKYVRKGSTFWYEDAKGNRYGDIHHPEFNDVAFPVRGGQAVPFAKIAFPERLANKLMFYINPPERSYLERGMDAFNRVFRTTALYSPDYFMEPIMGNILKNMTQGVKTEDWMDAYRALFGKADNSTYRIRVKGEWVERPLTELRDTLRYSHSVGGHSQYSEAQMEAMLFMGKRMTYKGNLYGKGKIVLDKVWDGVKYTAGFFNKYGAKGEDFTKAALMTSLLKKGYSADRAAYMVEKTLFNFSRVPQGTQFVRRYLAPFFQHPMKTLEILPLMAKRPGFTNLYENTIKKTMANAYQDPISQWAIMQLMPEYEKFADRVAGPLLPGNNWLAMAAKHTDGKSQLPGAITLGLPGSWGILQKFALWEPEAQKDWANGSPQLKALGILFFGRDVTNGVDVDVGKNSVELGRRFSYAARAFIADGIALPGVKKQIFQGLGIGDPQYFEPKTMTLMNSSIGRFGKLTNLDKEYAIKMSSLIANEKALTKKLFTAATQEVLTTKATGVTSFLGKLQPFSSREVVEKIAENRAEAFKTKAALAVLTDPAANLTSVHNLGRLILNIHEQVKALNENYQVLSERYHEVAKQLKGEQLEQANKDYLKKLKGLVGDESPDQ